MTFLRQNKAYSYEAPFMHLYFGNERILMLDQGFTTLRQSDYDFKATLRVLIGRPVGDAGGGSYAFFFNKETFLGKDSTSPSTKMAVAKQGKTSVTLSYDTSAGRTKVRFKLGAAGLQPLDPIPAPAERFTPRGN